MTTGTGIAGLLKNGETVNATTRLVYFIYIIEGLMGEMGVLGDAFKKRCGGRPTEP